MPERASNKQRTDIDLSPKDIQALGSADAVAALFARLHYNTNARAPLTAASLGLPDALAKRIKRVERIVDHEGLLQVHLFELQSITLADIRQLARRFRDVAVLYNLLVLTTPDYDQIDFVLIEREQTKEVDGRPGRGQSVANVRPRRLTVERRNPDPERQIVTLRVLRRFTFTEKDPFDQNAKLLSAYTIADWSEADFNNRALFADHFLKWRLREYPAWNEDTKPTYIKLADLFAGARGHLSEANEAEARKQLLEPVLKILGFDFKTGKKAGSGGAEPDYRLFAQGSEKPVAFCLAYRWDRFLDGQDELRDSESPNEFPARLAVDLLERGEASWGIVTNGRLWRLYSGKTYAKGTNYYEIDLEEVVSRADVADSFRYFWLLFRAQAFVPQPKDGEEPGAARSFLDEILAGSEEYAKKLGEALKERIFEEIFPHLAEGFIAYIRQKEGKDAELSDERLREIFHGTLTLLYRLLFLLYAEARDLLPVRDPRGYGEVSLGRIKKEIAETAGTLRGKPGDDAKLRERYREERFDLYKRLLELCRVIDKGDAARNVPLYNGGLFLSDPEKDDETPEAEAARFLSKHLLPDRYFAPALDLLSRDVDEKSSQLVFIDYKSLGVRQLGSIYEGLLEFRLQIAKEKLGIKKEKGRELYESFKKLPEKDQIKAEKTGKVIKKGAVYLENDKRERKATGSYYTPDYIVKYIVEHAVGPVLEERFEKLRPKLREAEKWHREKMKQVEGARHPGETREKYAFGPAVEERWGSITDDLLDVKVLDPAMGSGHFLVEVVDFISDKLMKFLNAFSWDPLTARLKYIQQTIFAEMNKQGITIAREKLDLDLLLKRQVLKRCIYGVDLNPMAVELAKVSLWLHCFTLGAPLSFLDHHLRCGNSLVGVTEEEVKKASSSGQMNLLAGTHLAATKTAVGGMLLVSRLSDVTATQIHESQEAYERALKALEPEKRLFDVYVSQWFSNAPKKGKKGERTSDRTPVDEFLRGSHVSKWMNAPEKVSLSSSEQNLIQNATDDARAHRFFHWELEFPEVFFGPKEGTETVIERKSDGGFDAVVGNPPWGATLTKSEKGYLKTLYPYSSGGIVDTFSLFTEKGIALLRHGSSIGLLLPDILLLKNYPGIRKHLLNHTTLMSVIHWGRPFPEVNLDVCSLVAVGASAPKDHKVFCIPEVTLNDIALSEPNLIPQSTFTKNKDFKFNLHLTDKLYSILVRARSLGPACGDVFTIREGVHSGNVRARLFLDEKAGNICEPVLFGRDEIRPLHLSWHGKWIQLDPKAFNRDKGDYFNLGNDTLHHSKKILVRRTGDKVIAAVDVEGLFASNNFFLCVPNPNLSWDDCLYAAALLNSSFATWYFIAIQPRKGRLFAEIKINHLSEIPLPFLKSPERSEWRQRVARRVESLLKKDDPCAVAAFILEFERELMALIREFDSELVSALEVG